MIAGASARAMRKSHRTVNDGVSKPESGPVELGSLLGLTVAKDGAWNGI